MRTWTKDRAPKKAESSPGSRTGISATLKTAAQIALASIAVFLVAGILPASPSEAYANSAEPPGLTVLVPFPTEDLSLTIQLAGNDMSEEISSGKGHKMWEGHYYFWTHGLPMSSLEGAVLLVQSGEKAFEIPLPDDAYGNYNILLTLDYKNETLTAGQPALRQPLLISMRVILTLLIEGLIFLAFGYRKMASWITFLIVNLLTQGALNIILSGGPYYYDGYLLLVLFACESFIILIEVLAFALILREHKKERAVLFAVAANVASFVLGGLLITLFPI